MFLHQSNTSLLGLHLESSMTYILIFCFCHSWFLSFSCTSVAQCKMRPSLRTVLWCSLTRTTRHEISVIALWIQRMIPDLDVESFYCSATWTLIRRAEIFCCIYLRSRQRRDDGDRPSMHTKHLTAPLSTTICKNHVLAARWCFATRVFLSVCTHSWNFSLLSFLRQVAEHLFWDSDKWMH